MAKFTDSQRKLLFGGGIFAMIAALVSLGITIGRVGSSGSSIAVSMLLLVVGIMLIIIPQLAKKD